MPKYIKEIPEYIPGIQPWRPNLQLYQNVLTRRQQQFNAGHEKVDSLYNSIFNADLTRPDDIKKRDEFLKLADNEIKRLSTVDLSNPANRKAAYSIFKPFYEDDNIMHDIGYTKQVKKAYQEAEDSRKCIGDDCPEFWNGSLRYIDYKKQEYANSTDEEALSMGAPRFIPAQNISKEGLKLIKESGLKSSYPEFSEDGKWMYTVKNGETFIPTVQSFLQTTLGSDPKYLDYYNAQAYLDKKDWMSQNSMKYQSDQLAEERYAKEVLDNSWDVYTDEQMQNNFTSNIIDHKQSAMEEWLAQGNIPMPSDSQHMEENLSQKQIVDAEKQRLEKIKQLHDAYGININDPSTYTNIIEQINGNYLLSDDIYNTAYSYAMGTREITGFKSNPYKVEEIRHSNKMLEIRQKGIYDWLKEEAKIGKAEDAANAREKNNEQKGGKGDELIVAKDDSGSDAFRYIFPNSAEENSNTHIKEYEEIDELQNDIQNLSDFSLKTIFNEIKNDPVNGPLIGSAAVDNVFEDIFSSLGLIPDYGHPSYDKSNSGLTLYYHHSQDPENTGYWDTQPFNEHDTKIHQQMAAADGKKFDVQMTNNTYGKTRDVLTGSGNILRDFNAMAKTKSNAAWNLLGQKYIGNSGEKYFADKSNKELLEVVEDSKSLIDVENTKNTEILTRVNSLLKSAGLDPLRLNFRDSNKNLVNLKINKDGTGVATYQENDDVYTVNITADRVKQIRSNKSKFTGKPTPGDLYRKKLELQNWLTSKERTPVEIKQFYLDFENAFKDNNLYDVDNVMLGGALSFGGVRVQKDAGQIDKLGNSILGKNSNHSLLRMLSEIVGTSEKGRTGLAEKYGILPSGYLNGKTGTTYEQIRLGLNNTMKEINKQKLSQKNLTDRREEELTAYNDLFLKNLGDPKPGSENERFNESDDRKIWSNLSKLYLPTVNGKTELYPVTEDEFVNMYVMEAMKGVDGWLEVSPSNPSDWFDADVNYNFEGAPGYNPKIAEGVGPSFIGYGGYWREDAEELFFSDDDGWDYGKIGFSKSFMNDRRKVYPNAFAGDYLPEKIHRVGIMHDAKLAYKLLNQNYMDMYYKSADYPSIGVTGYNIAPGLEHFGAGSTVTSKPIIDTEVANNEIYSKSYQYGKEFIENFLKLREMDDESVIKDGINKDYTVKYANGKSGSIAANDILTVLKHDFFDPSDVIIKYDKYGIPYQSGELFNAKGELKDKSDFSTSIKFKENIDGSLAMTIIPSPELVNKSEYKGQSKKTVYQNEAAVKGGIVITIPERSAKQMSVNKVFRGQTLNNGLALGFDINDFSNTAGIVKVEKVNLNPETNKYSGTAWITSNGIRNNSVTGEPEYFKMEPIKYTSSENEVAYSSASELYDELYENLQSDDKALRMIMNEAIILYKDGKDINGNPLKNQNNATQ